MLNLKTENCRIAAVYDTRYETPVDITDGSGNFGRPVYTLKSQDITKEKKPEFTPYNDYSVPYTETENGILLNKDFGVSLTAEEADGGIVLEINFTNDDVSACGISLPFSFMGQKNNSWERQFTASSPYRTADGKHLMFYLVRPDGKNLVCIAENETDGYRINYSDFLCGHYIMGIQLISQFDRAYGRRTRAEKRVRLHIKAASDYREALEKASVLWGIPALYYETASGYIMIAPFALIFTTLTILPILASLFFGFTSFDSISMPQWVGLENYFRMFSSDDVFPVVLKNTILMAVITGPIGFLMSFALAWFVSEFKPFTRTLLSFMFYAPSLVGNALYIWKVAFSGERYGYINSFLMSTGLITEPIVWLKEPQYIQNEDFVSTVFEFSAQEGITYTVEKKVYIIASIDTKENLKDVVKGKLHQLASKRYCELKEKSIRSYIELFNKLDIKIKGDFEADSAVRFANYHTLISVERNDCVHSLSAKGLTGEAYNNFVWWDSEVYQSPVFMQTIPEAARNTLIYRYNRLDKAKELAIAQGMKGARFPFTSCVTGEETVWSDVRHPFMQIHVISDIGLGILKYYKCTADVDFMQNYGFEMLIEICRYWVSRVKWIEKNKRYEILCVTGTDEHHPYVDNNAYTNYSVNIVLKETLRLLDELAEVAGDAVVKTRLEKKELSEFSTVSNNLYLPMEKTKMIPQFDGYFDLSKELEIEGGSSAKNFQMKFSGLYNKSQVIKQPDVMLLFSYMDLDFGETAYARNWDYYQARCESSSSLSYPVHSICSSDMNQPESAYKYLLKSARLDIDDDHNCAKDGMHSACAAGAWLSVVRGIAGMKIHENIVTFDPHFIPWWDEVRYSAIWHGQRFKVILNDENIKVTANDKNTMTLPISICGKNHDIKPGRNVTEAIIHK